MRVHPTQLYEVAISTAIFFLIWRLRRHPHGAGWLFMVYLVFAGLERAFVELFRAKDDRLLGAFTLAQLISVMLILGGAYGAWSLSQGRRAKRVASAP